MGIHTVYNARLASKFTSYAAGATRTFRRQEEKRTKWAADFTHFRAGNKANASKAECEPREGDHEERTSGLAQSEARAK
ncbi:hypothetical protein BDN71DRAFT_1455527, partial [Pleurotus eryngii]